MSAVAWWAIPVVATLLAVLWVSWAGRSRPPADVYESLETYRRFKDAMENDRRGSAVGQVGRRSRLRRLPRRRDRGS